MLFGAKNFLGLFPKLECVHFDLCLKFQWWTYMFCVANVSANYAVDTFVLFYFASHPILN